MAIAYTCNGTTRHNEPCKNITTNANKWCGKCKNPDSNSPSGNSLGKSDFDYFPDTPDEITEPLGKIETYSGEGAASVDYAVEMVSERLRALGFSEGINISTIKRTTSQKIPTDYLDLGKWVDGTYAHTNNFSTHMEYAPIIANEPLTAPVVAVFSRTNQEEVVPLYIPDNYYQSMRNQNCKTCNSKLEGKSYVVLNKGKNEAVCQTCYVRETASKNKNVIEDLQQVIEDSNIIWDHDIREDSMIDGDILRTLSLASVVFSNGDEEQALNNLENLLDKDPANPDFEINQTILTSGENIYGYAKDALSTEGFLQPHELEIFEDMMKPGYDEKDYQKVLRLVEHMNNFDQIAIDRNIEEIQAKAGYRSVGTHIADLAKVEGLITNVETNDDYTTKTLTMIGSDGRKYITRVHPSQGNAFSFNQGEAITLNNSIVSSVDTPYEETIPFHTITLPENSSSRVLGHNCGNGTSHYWHTTENVFPIFSRNLLAKDKIAVCVVCKETDLIME